jgi:hypothetical protein
MLGLLVFVVPKFILRSYPKLEKIDIFGVKFHSYIVWNFWNEISSSVLKNRTLAFYVHDKVVLWCASIRTSSIRTIWHQKLRTIWQNLSCLYWRKSQQLFIIFSYVSVTETTVTLIFPTLVLKKF